MIPASWLLLSILIGYLGRYSILGSWGCFLVSFFFSPLVGALVLAVIRTTPHRA